MLDVSSTLQSALAGDSLHFAWLLTIGDSEIVSNNLHFTTHGTDIVHGGKTFVSKGDVLRMSNVSRERQIKLQRYTVEFSNVDRLLAEAFLQTDRTGQMCDVHLALLDEAGDILGGELVHLYRGAFESWTERESGSSASLRLQLTSPWDKPNLTAGRMTSQHNQSDRYDGDMFFSFAHEEKNTIGWGAGDE